MSYFDTIQGYMNNNNEIQQHISEIGNEFASEKAKTLKDKFDSVNGDIEKWGGALQGASSGWWMGRKIIRKIRSYTPDEQTRAQGGEKGDFNEEEMSKLGDTEKGAMKFGDKPELDVDNPFARDIPKMDKPSDTDADTSGERAPEPNLEEADANYGEVAPLEPIAEEAEEVERSTQDIADNISNMTSRAKASAQRTQDAVNRAKEPESSNNPQEDPARGNEPDVKPDEEPEGTSGNDADALNETKPIANETENATNDLVENSTKDLVEDGTKAVVTNIAEKTGVKSGLEIAGETLADSIPVVGEVIAVGTMIGGLFRDLFDKHHEEVKEATAKLSGASAGIQQVGGMDVSAIASTAGNVAGLV